MFERFEDLARLLGGLKGARGSVVWTLSLAGRPLSQQELQLLTGYSPKPVREAVHTLLSRGVVRWDGPRVLTLADDWPRLAAESADIATRVRSTQARSNDERLDDAGDEVRIPAADGYLGRGRMAEAAVSPDTPAADSIGQRSKTAAAGQKRAKSGRFTRGEGGFGRQQHGVVAADRDRGSYQDDQQQQPGKIPKQATRLAVVLRRMGVTGPAFWRLVAREDLAARPEVALAWWWYYRAQEGIRNPAGAAISRLYGRDEPPEGYLALVELWPGLDEALRLELESMVLHNWPAEQIAAHLGPDCPQLTAAAVLAFMTLSQEELDG